MTCLLMYFLSKVFESRLMDCLHTLHGLTSSVCRAEELSRDLRPRTIIREERRKRCKSVMFEVMQQFGLDGSGKKGVK